MELNSHRAAQRADYVAVKLLLQDGINVDIKDETWETPLYHAVRRGDYAIAQLLLNQSANVNARPKDGDLMLHVATSKENYSMVQLLFGNEAEVEEKWLLRQFRAAITRCQCQYQICRRADSVIRGGFATGTNDFGGVAGEGSPPGVSFV